MNKKRVLLISHNFSPELVGMGKYNGEMINWLVERGHDCTVITTFPYYPFWKVQKPYRNLWYKKETNINPISGAKLSVYRCPTYIPKDPTGKQRTLQDFSLWLSKFFTIFKLILTNQKFDLIITVAPPFHLAYLGLMLKKVTGGKLLYHVQDLQIEAARDLKLFSNKEILGNLFRVEHRILRLADYVSSISDGMIKKIQCKIKRDVVFFPNWVDTSYFYPLPDRNLLKLKWGYKETDIVYMYSGAIGVKQGLEDILTSIEHLKEHEHIKFIICSSGPYKDLLLQQSEAKGLTNVAFLPVQPKEHFNEFLNMADIHLVIQKASAEDLVMPSKLATILAVGGASIITASNGTSLYQMAEEGDFGYVVEPANDKSITDQILAIALNDQLEQKRANARNYALKYLNVDKVMSDFIDNFLSE
ncbi:MAG: WcaI family glycosyltransferase [Mucilaginibacter sp.]